MLQSICNSDFISFTSGITNATWKYNFWTKHKKGKKKPTMKNLSRFMQRNEWDTADVTGLVLPWILTSAKAAN